MKSFLRRPAHLQKLPPLKHPPTKRQAMASYVSAALVLLSLAGCSTPNTTQIAESYLPSIDKRTGADIVATKVEPAPRSGEPIQQMPYPERTRLMPTALAQRVDLRDRKLVVRAPAQSLYETIEVLAFALEMPVRLTRDAQIAVERNAAHAATNLDYAGDAAQVLTRIAGQYGLYWRPTRDAIEFFATETRVFNLDVLAETLVSSVGMSGQANVGGGTSSGGASSGGSSGGDSRTTFSATSDMFTSTADSVRAMLSPSGKVQASAALGTITVTDSPDVLLSVEQFIATTSASLNQVITFEVRVFALQHTNTTSYGVDFGLLAANLTRDFGIRGVLASSVDAVQNAFSLVIPSTATGQLAKFSGSEMIARALATQGKIAQWYSGTFRTTNRVPTSFANGTEIIYSSRSGAVTNNTGGNTATSASIEPSSREVGLSMNVHPIVTTDGAVNMRWYMSITKLDELRKITQGAGANQFVQELPRISLTKLAQVSRLRSGQTLMIAGYEQTTDQDGRQGPFANSSWFGGETSASTKTTLIVTITPVVSSLDVSASMAPSPSGEENRPETVKSSG